MSLRMPAILQSGGTTISGLRCLGIAWDWVQAKEGCLLGLFMYFLFCLVCCPEKRKGVGALY